MLSLERKRERAACGRFQGGLNDVLSVKVYSMGSLTNVDMTAKNKKRSYFLLKNKFKNKKGGRRDEEVS